MIEMGETKVLCNATVEEKVPSFKKGTNEGWVTAEYSMLPRATESRNVRDVNRLKISGRSHEIQRLIGRALRAVVNLSFLGEREIIIDCDVIQADGGTRTAAITGAFVAMADACSKLVENGTIAKMPITDFVAAVSTGFVDNNVYVDLCYREDSAAIADMNVVMTENSGFVEVQVTGEQAPIDRKTFNEMLNISEIGIKQLIKEQRRTLGKISNMIGEIGKHEKVDYCIEE
jgi:ribonuclease PH